MGCEQEPFRIGSQSIGLLAALALIAASANAEDGASPLGKYSQDSCSLADAGEAGEPLVVNLHSRDDPLRTGWASVGHETGFLRERNEDGRAVCYDLHADNQEWRDVPRRVILIASQRPGVSRTEETILPGLPRNNVTFQTESRKGGR
jgi:hypothetical protein